MIISIVLNPSLRVVIRTTENLHGESLTVKRAVNQTITSLRL